MSHQITTGEAIGTVIVLVGIVFTAVMVGLLFLKLMAWLIEGLDDPEDTTTHG